MPPHMQSHATSLADKTLHDSSIPAATLHNATARALKKAFDAEYGGVWHCVVGKNFGSFVVHETGGFVYFYLQGVAVLLFRSGTQ